MKTNESVELQVKNFKSENASELEVASLNLKNLGNSYLIHKALVIQNKNARQNTVSTKTRSEVRGGGRKPWKQKGTGRARAGSNSSPLWKGGGVTFGPKPKTKKYKINQKERQLALRTIIANKTKNTLVLKNFFDNCINISKTKNFCNLLNSFINLEENKNKKILLIVPKKVEALKLATQNLANFELIEDKHLNIKSLLNSNQILICFESLKTIEETYNGI